MIEPDAELVLIDRLVAGAPVIVGSPGTRGQRIPGQKRSCDRIDSRRGNRVSWKGSAGGRPRHSGRSCRRIVNRVHAPADDLGEYSLALQQRGYGGDDGASDRLPLALIVDEQE